MASPTRTLLVIGSGPGIGRSVATLFAKQRYGNVVLIARRAEQLQSDRAALEAVVPNAKVKTFAVDVTDLDALGRALQDAEVVFGKPELVFFNAARVLPSELLTHDVKDIKYELDIEVSALYTVAQRTLPHLVQLAKTDAAAKPALLVTSSLLPQHPMPALFSLSLAKAAQRSLVQCLHQTYGPEGVHVGVVNVQGPVSAADPVRNPDNIAAKTWAWFDGSKDFEVVI